MGAVSFSIYFYIHDIWLFIITYAIFQGLFAPAMPQLYASARESINISSSRKMLNLPIQCYDQCFLLASFSGR